jgi:hypothetical protein
LKHATLVYRVHLLQLHESQLYSALTRGKKPECVKARDNLKLCDFLFHEMYVTFLPTAKNYGFRPCLQGNNNLIRIIIIIIVIIIIIIIIIIASSVILYGETPDEGWGG